MHAAGEELSYDLMKKYAVCRQHNSLSKRLNDQEAERQRYLGDVIAAVRRKLEESSREPEVALAALDNIDASLDNIDAAYLQRPLKSLHCIKGIELVRTQQQTKLSVRDRVRNELANLGIILEESVEEPPVGETSAKKKRKGRKKGHKEAPQTAPSSRQEQLAQVHSTAVSQKNDVLEKLVPLESELKQADVPYEQVSIIREKTEESLRRIQEKITEKKTSRRMPTQCSERLPH